MELRARAQERYTGSSESGIITCRFGSVTKSCVRLCEQSICEACVGCAEAQIMFPGAAEPAEPGSLLARCKHLEQALDHAGGTVLL
jgi:hypothetical protein